MKIIKCFLIFMFFAKGFANAGTPKKIITNISNINSLSLTFDDGPDEIWTPKILDILKNNNVKATFFVVGFFVDKYPEIVKQIVKDGHEIGVHTYTHPLLTKVSASVVASEIQKTINAIHNILPDYEIKLFRAPYGAMNDKIKEIVKQFGLKPVWWDIDTEDWKQSSSALTIKNAIYASRYKVGIVLMHDGIDAPTMLVKMGVIHNTKLNPEIRQNKKNVVKFLKVYLPSLKKDYLIEELIGV